MKNKLKILGYTYKIQHSGSNEMNGGTFGKMNPKEQVIQISDDSCDEQKETTLLHEVIEAINFHLNIGLRETQIMQIEAGLYSFLKDSKLNLLGGYFDHRN